MDNFQEHPMEAQEYTKQQEEALEQCQIQLNDIKNKYLHLNADFENFKKRQEKERLQWTKVAQMDVLTPLLNVVDDFDRALSIQKKESISQEFSSWLAGFELIHKELLKYLEKIGIKEIKIDNGQAFDPEFHESIMMIKSDAPSESIVEVLQKGYTFKEAILRPAKVSISK